MVIDLISITTVSNKLSYSRQISISKVQYSWTNSGTRWLEALFDKYVISADMTYTKLSSFSTLITFVVTTSYNIGLPGIYRPLNESDPGCEIWSHLHCNTRLRAIQKHQFRRHSLGDVFFKFPQLQYARSNFAKYQRS